VAHPASYTMGTVSFPGVKLPGRGVDHPPTSSTEVKERVELYLYSPSEPSWPVLGWTLPVPVLLQWRLPNTGRYEQPAAVQNGCVAVRRQVSCTLDCLNTLVSLTAIRFDGIHPAVRRLNDNISYKHYNDITQELTVIEQWKEWLATIPDGKLPTNQKTEG